MKVNITQLPPRAVLYARATGPYSTGADAAWRQLIDWLTERDRQSEVYSGYGWFRDDPSTTNPFLQRYDACIELLAGLSSDFRAGVGRQTLPGGLYLVHQTAETQRSGFRFSELAGIPGLDDSRLAVDPERSMLERVTFDAKAGVWSASPHVLVPVAEPKAETQSRGLRVA